MDPGSNYSISNYRALADPGEGGVSRVHFFSISMQFLGKIAQNNKYVPPFLRLATLHWGILNPPL